MFKNEEQVKAFVDMTEKFVLAVIRNENSHQVEDAVALNKVRDLYETLLEVISGITSLTNAQPETLLCPECNSEMALRTNRTNGNKFWGCKKYPNCKGTRDENGLSREEREAKKLKQEEVTQQGGFSFNRDKRNPVTEVSPPVETGWVNPFSK